MLPPPWLCFPLGEAGGWQSGIWWCWEQAVLLVVRGISFSMELVPTSHRKDSAFNPTRIPELKDLIAPWVR